MSLAKSRLVTWISLINFVVWSIAPQSWWNLAHAQAAAERVQIPVVVGMSAADAKRVVEAAGLAVEFRVGPAAPAAALKLTVKEVSPSMSTLAARGSTVNLTLYADDIAPVTTSTPPGTVPSLLGMPAKQARETLTALGYTTQFYVGPKPTAPQYALSVYYQQPEPGKELKAGQMVHVGLYAPSEKSNVGNSTETGAESVRDFGPSLAGVLAEPFIDERNERINPRTGLLSMEHLDMSVPAGPLTLELRRYLRRDVGRPSVLGGQWRHNWDKRLVRSGADVSLLEQSGWLAFQPLGAGKYVSPLGDVLLLDASSAQCFRPDNTCEKYDAEGRLTEVDVLNGNFLRLQYDAAGRLSRVEGPFGSFLSLMTDNSGRLVQVSSSSGANVRYFYGSVDDVPAEVPVRFEYDAASRLASMQQPRDGKTMFEYDSQGRVIARRFADGAAERWEYDDTAHLRRHTDVLGSLSTAQLDPKQRSIETVDPLGYRTKIQTDDAARPISITGPDNRQIQTQFDELGRMTDLLGTAAGDWHFEYFRDTHVMTAFTLPDGRRILRQFDLNRNLLSIAHEQDDAKDVEFEYLPNGLLKRIVRRGDRAYTNTYDNQGRLTKLTDPAGNEGIFEYDRHGRLLRFVDPEGRATTNNYDLNGRLISSTDASGAMTRYEYDRAGLPAREIDAGGGITQYEYDARGRRVARTDALGRTERWSYDADGRQISSTDASGAITRYEYDADGNRIRQVNALGGATTAVFDALGRITSRRDASGAITRFEYTPAGQLARRTDPDGGQATFEYDAANRMTVETDRFGRITRHEYNRHDNLTRTIAPNGVVTTRQYDDADQLVALLEDGRPIARYEYDKLGNRTREILATGREMNYEYDTQGRVTAWSDNLGGSGTTRYDIEGRPLEVVDAAGGKTRYRYDLAGRLLGMTDALGRTGRRTHDVAGQLTSLANAAGDQVHYEYDLVGRVVKLVRPNGGENRYAYDPLGNPIQMTDPLGHVTRTQYDPAGRLVESTDPLGQITTYVYDSTGRVLEKRLADGRVVSYRYDPQGNLVEVDDGEFPVRYKFDEQGRRILVEYPAIRRSLTYAYDARDRRTSLVDSDGTKTEYEYDVHNRLVGIRCGEERTELSYDAAGRRTAVVYSNGVKGRWEYDAAGRVAEISYQAPDEQVLAAWSYSYDASGQLTNATAADGEKIAYCYDPAGQLLECRRGERDAVRFEYSSSGNRSRRISGSEVTEYRYDEADRLLAAGDDQLRYDDNGNLIERRSADGTTYYRYNAENKLVRVEQSDGNVVSFGYAPTGERIWRENADGRTWYVNDGRNTVAELDAQFKVQKRFMHGPQIDDVLAVQQGDETFCLHADRLGSVRRFSGSDGRQIGRRDFEPFGLPRGEWSGPECSIAYTGRDYDADTGLYYYRARYYDPALGRFLSHDPLPGKQDEPLSLNPYLYAFNNPMRFTDPLGTDSLAIATQQHIVGMTPQQALNFLGQQSQAVYQMLQNLYQGYEGGYYRGPASSVEQSLRNDMYQIGQMMQQQQALLDNPPPAPTSSPPAPPTQPSGGGLLAAEPEPLPSGGSAGATGPRPANVGTVATRMPQGSGGTPVSSEPPVNLGDTRPIPRGTLVPASSGIGGFTRNVWSNIKNGVSSRLGRALTALGVGVVVYNTATAPPGHRGHVAASGTGGLVGGIGGGAILTTLVFGSNPVGWGAIFVGLTGSFIGGTIGGGVGGWLVPASHSMSGDVTTNPLYQSQQKALQSRSSTTSGVTIFDDGDDTRRLDRPPVTGSSSFKATDADFLLNLERNWKPSAPTAAELADFDHRREQMTVEAQPSTDQDLVAGHLVRARELNTSLSQTPARGKNNRGLAQNPNAPQAGSRLRNVDPQRAANAAAAGLQIYNTIRGFTGGFGGFGHH